MPFSRRFLASLVIVVAAITTGSAIRAVAQDLGRVPTSAEASALSSQLLDVAIAARDVAFPVISNSTFERRAATGAGVSRSRLISIDPTALEAFRQAPDLRLDPGGRPIGPLPSIAISLFDDVSVRLVKLDATSNDLGQTTIRAVVAGDVSGTATLVLDGVTVAGSIKFGGRYFSVLSAGEGLHSVFELDAAAARSVKNDAKRHPFSRGSNAERTSIEQQISDPLHAGQSRERAAAAAHQITLFVAYTAAASSTIPNIKSAIALAVSDTNTAFANSQIPAEIRLVGVERVNSQDTSRDMSEMLDALTEGEGDFERIQRLHAALDTDLVSIVTKTTDACGLAWLNVDLDLRLTASSARFGASLVAADVGGTCLATNTLAHEIGHNLGAEHDRFQVEDDEPGPRKYAYGYVDLTGRFRDLMSYDDECDANSVSCTELPLFSNPEVTHQGRPVGIRFDLPNGADSARKIRATVPNAALLDTMIAPASSPALSVVVSGTSSASGSVTSTPAGINCGDQCAAFFSGNPQVSLAATAAPRSVLREWSGDCSGAASCSVSMAASRSVTAQFERAERPGPLYSSVNADA
ncbi:MAG: hypothetical protein FJX59_04635 [Alphaproteobacteria bacterium]|nr:hypothetical protein [Alphaproteobacteria bacterium]